MPTRLQSLPGTVIVVIGLVLGMVIAPLSVAAQDAATPQVVPVATPGATPAPALQPTAEEFSPGDVLETTANLILRAQPTTDAEALQSLPEGTPLQVISGPEQAEAFAWYEVSVIDTEESVSGWVATSADFVDSEDGDEPAEDEFAFGATLTTTTENLRLRAEPTVDAEALQTLPQGTQLQVISGPEQAEGFDWYEVEVLDTEESVSGWVATSADFVDAVEVET